MKKLILFTGLALLSNFVFGQIDFVTYGSRAAVSTNMANSAMELPGDLSFTFPGLSSFSISAISSLSPDEFIRGQPDGRNLVDIDLLISNLQDLNGVQSHIEYSPLFVSWHSKSRKGFFSVAYHQIVDLKGVLSNEMITYLGRGNASFLDQNVSITDDQFGIQHYSKIHLGYTRLINPKLSIGGKINAYGGFNHFEISKLKANLFTDSNSFPAYATSAAVDFEALGGGVVAKEIDEDDTYSFGGPGEILGIGKGFGIDLAVNYKFDDNFSASVSGRDLGGYIKWEEEFGRKITLGGSGQLNFDGFETSFSAEDPGAEFEEQVDELEEELKNEFDLITLEEAYRSSIGSSFTLSGQFLSNNKKHAVLGVINGRNNFNEFDYRAGMVYHYSPSKWIQLSTSYSWMKAAPVNLGTGLTLNFGSTQFHFSSDNIVSFFNQANLGQAAFRFGFNIVYAKKEDPFAVEVLNPNSPETEESEMKNTKKYF